MFTRHLNKNYHRQGKVSSLFVNLITCSNPRHDNSIYPKEAVPLDLFINSHNEDLTFKSCLNCRKNK